MNIFDQLPDISLILNITKWLGYAFAFWLCLWGSSGCGIKAGNSFVIGTTGFLDTAQQTQAEHTERDKAELRRVIR